MLPADLVADHPHIFQSPGCKVQFPPGIRLDGVDDEVRVEMIRIKVRCHQDLAARKKLFRQFQCDSMRLCRSDLFLWREGLDILVEECVVRLAVQIFSGHETLVRQLRHTVDAGEVADSILIQGLLILGHVAHDAFHRSGCLLGFFDKATCCHGTPLALFL